jgi:DNA-binding HxlR family transcriptional regulator
MPARRYGQLCGVARSLDLIGERWTLLIVRELLLGPKRFGTLEAALPGIGPNLLSARLSSLTEAGLVERTTLPPPASIPAYALTARGEGLREPVEALAIWGVELLDPERDLANGDLARGAWLANTLAAAAARRGRPSRTGVTVNFDVDGDRFSVALGSDRVHVRHGEREGADGDLSCDLRTFYELTRGERGAPDPALATVLAELAPPASA